MYIISETTQPVNFKALTPPRARERNKHMVVDGTTVVNLNLRVPSRDSRGPGGVALGGSFPGWTRRTQVPSDGGEMQAGAARLGAA